MDPRRQLPDPGGPCPGRQGRPGADHGPGAGIRDPGQRNHLSVPFDHRFPIDYESCRAAADTLGGRFPGGQTSLFQGLWTDPVTGIAYARARWYDARNATWLSEDPLLDVDSPNLYAFVGWAPTMGTDPLGTCWGKLALIGASHLPGLAGSGGGDQSHYRKDVAVMGPPHGGRRRQYRHLGSGRGNQKKHQGLRQHPRDP